MESISGVAKTDFLEIGDISSEIFGQTVKMRGIVHNVRDMSGFTFVILRKRDGIVQLVQPDTLELAVKNGDSIAVEGVVNEEKRAPGGFEIVIQKAEVLSSAAGPMPIDIAKYKLNTSIEALLELRPVTLRNLQQRAIFKIQEGIARGFREYLVSQNFTEVHTPKIVAAGAEGGANIFKLEYFNKKAFLAQSPQFYKQMLVPVYERVFEIGPVFRAEKHSTARHLNEYTSMDFEMGFIDSFHDIMAVETEMLQYTFDLLKREYGKQVAALKIQLPNVSSIPMVRFDDAKRMVSEKYHTKIRNPFDLEPEEEHNISRLFQEEYGSDFVFVTHYPSKKRPFYAMDDPADPRYTLSFDLLFRGMEITTGGQRIHDYDQQVAKMQARNMNPADFESYLMTHKCGTPPHGGLGIGLERLTMKLLEQDNVRYSCMFPRDLKRLEP